ncbi:MAG TPA: DUF2934 domain-containing protein [Burkholderiales bacterium]|jgi:hypothetical protein|nr:DUF2934 domain-containing protein [Burkholderiales bacterium]
MNWPFHAVHEDSGNTEPQPCAPVEPQPEASDRQRRVAEAAYYRAERRGFVAGFEEEDWLEAERELGLPATPQPSE